MPISAAIGIGSAIAEGIGAVGGAIATGLGALAPEAALAGEVGAGAAAADVGGAIALPEIAVTAAAPEVAAGVGTEAALGGGLVGGGLTGAEAAGAGLLSAAPLAGAGGAAATGALGAGEALGGAAAPLTALSPAGVVGQDFAALDAAGIGAATDISGGGTGLGAAADTALSFAPSTAPIDPFAGVGVSGSGPGAFAGAPEATEGQIPADLATALNTGQIGAGTTPSDIFTMAQEPGTVGQLTAGTGIPPQQAMDVPGAITPAAGTPTAGISATPGSTDFNATAASIAAPSGTSALPAGTSLTGAGGGVSGAAGSLFSGSTLRTLGELAPLGALGLVLARGQPGLPSAEQQALQNVSPGSPVATTATQNLTEANTGILQPGEAAQIQQYTTNAKNQLYQLYARMGRDPTGDTDYIQGLAAIDQQAQVMAQGFISNAVKNGLAAQGVVDSTLQAAAQMQIQQDQAFQSSITAAMQSFGLVTALNVAGSRGAAAAPQA